MTTTQNYDEITARCFINAPFDHLQKGLLEVFLQHRLQPEIGLEGNCLWDRSQDDFIRIARTFQQQGLSCTLHAPFHDLAPGGFDRRIVELSRKKMDLAFSLIPVFKPEAIVCHLGFEANKHASNLQRWLETSIETWTELIGRANSAGIKVMFENTYEKDPSAHRALFAAFEDKQIGFCMDTGHLTAFAGTGWQPWLAELSPWLGQLHLHDNDGKGDAHLAVGEGVFDFPELFDYLHDRNLSPLITLEPHSEQDLWQSLKNIEKMNLF